MSYEFTTAKSIIENKILRNKAIAEVYMFEEMMSEKEIALTQKYINILQIKRKLMREINAIETEQLSMYSIDRANEIARLTDEVNNTEVSIMDRDKFFDDREKLVSKRYEYIQKINNYNSLIPDSAVITNIKALTYDPNETCHNPKYPSR